MELNNIIIDILPLSLLILILYKMKPVKPLRALDSTEYLSVDTTKSYRGLFALVVIFHHLSRLTESGVIFHKFTLVGYLAVAYFFFLSGYGLQKSYISKGENYTKGFLLKRLPSVILPYLIIIFAFWLMYFVSGRVFSLKDIGLTFIGGKPFVPYSWYILCIIIFYIVYWLLMLICKKRYFPMILGAAAWYILYCAVCIKLDYGSWWYNTALLPVIGMFWATYEKKLVDFIKKSYFIITPVIIVSFAALFVSYNRIMELVKIPAVSSVLKLPTAVLFVLGVILLSMKFSIGNKVLGFLGEISLEMYISQGLIFNILRGKFIYIKNELLFCAASIVVIIAFSVVFRVSCKFVLKKYRILLDKKILKVN